MDHPTRIRFFRQEAGLSTAELARRCGVHRATLARVDLGYERCWPKLLGALARELGVPESVLVHDRRAGVPPPRP